MVQIIYQVIIKHKHYRKLLSNIFKETYEENIGSTEHVNIINFMEIRYHIKILSCEAVSLQDGEIGYCWFDSKHDS